MEKDDLWKLHTNQRLLVEELIKRGMQVEMIDAEIELLRIVRGGHSEYLLDRFNSVAPHNLVKLSADKYLTKKLLLEAGLNVPQGELFYGNQFEKAETYAKSIGFPVVIKPNWGSHGDCVYSNIQSSETLKEYIRDFSKKNSVDSPFLLERQFTGKEYRIFITSRGDFAVLHRDPAHVVGDGQHTILELATITSAKRTNRQNNSLCPIVLDKMSEDYLSMTNRKLTDIPANNEKVYLRSTSNIAKGGVSSDATDIARSSAIDIAKRALEVFSSLPCVGIDLMTTDITKKQTKDNYVVLEVNSNPGLAMHMLPSIGKPRNVAKYLADVLFPQTL